MLSTTILRLFLVSAALLLLADNVAACSCSGPRQSAGFHPCMTYWTADAVFTGMVEEISFAQLDADGKPRPFSEKVAHFSVDEAFRGVEGRTIEITTNYNTPSCGYDFKQGQRYFVYARRDKDGKLKEWLCGPTVRLEEAAPDLAYARQALGGMKGQVLVGAVVKYERSDIKDHGTRLPVPGVEVVLERADHSGETLSKTVTNEEGKYEFHDLAVNTYRVRAAPPPGLREWSNDGKPKEHYVSINEGMRCGSDSFLFTNSSSIKGRLVTPDGSPLPSQYLALVPLDDRGNEISSSYTPGVSSVRESGDYYFREVPPGQYLVAVNPRNTPGKSSPVYPLMYYPGVMSRGRATVLQVLKSRDMTLNDFMLTSPLQERWFSGTVLLADKTPASGAKVILIDPNDLMMGTNVMEVTADERGRFRVKGYETFPYWIDAYDTNSGAPMYAPPVQLSKTGSVEGIELVISLTYRAQPYHK